MVCFAAFALALVASVAQGYVIPEIVNNRPIVGVVMMDSADNAHQHLSTGYVKFIESGGARVVPIFIDREPSYYEDLVKKINGVLMIGDVGSGDVNVMTSHYARTSQQILQLAVKMNQAGIHFPIWGTCLGFEKLISFKTGDEKWESSCYFVNISLNLDVPDKVIAEQNSTQLFQELTDPTLLEILKTQKVAPNYHRICLTIEDFHKHRIDEDYRILGTNKYRNTTIVSMMEHLKYPFFGSAFHPERNQFEFQVHADVGAPVHDRYGVALSQYFAQFFVNEARRNRNHFEDKNEEIDSLIFNFNQYLHYTGKEKADAFNDQEFIFPMKDV